MSGNRITRRILNRKIDLHTHTTCSDGVLSPADLVKKAKEIGLSALAITDHDTTAAWTQASHAAVLLDMELVSGVEISTKHQGMTVHILGYLFDPAHEGLQASLQRYIEARNRRNPLILEKLEEMGFPLTMEEVRAFSGGTVVNRPHFAEAMIDRGYVKSRQEAFERFLGDHAPAYVPKEVYSVKQAVDMLHAAGGVAVIAHPDQFRNNNLTQTLHVLQWLAELGVDGIEAYHGECKPDNALQYARLAEELGLFVTGGSDYHGDTKHRDLGVVSGVEYIPYECMEQMKVVSRKYQSAAIQP